MAYVPALGEVGMAVYRKRLAEVETRLGPQPSAWDRWTSGHSHEWFTLDWNAQSGLPLPVIQWACFLS